MVAFNFKVDFTPKIKSRIKTSTIRKTKRCSVGDTMQLYTGQRTKNCKKIMDDVVCVGTAHIRFTANHHIKPSCEEGVILNDPNGSLYDQEGFSSNEEMFEFFDKHYGLPFSGWLHVWK